MINLCKECDIRDICVMYADFAKHLGRVQLKLEACAFKQWNGETHKKVNTISVTSKREIDPFTGKFKVDRDKITEVSNKKRKEQEKEAKNLGKIKTKIGVEAKPLVLDHTCPGCGASTFKEDHSQCACGKDICSCCATTNGDNGELLCPECWANL